MKVFSKSGSNPAETIPKEVFKDYFTLEKEVLVNNGDGLCFFDNGEMKGSNVNTVSGPKIFLNSMSGIRKGMEIYRNVDTAFLKQIKESGPERKIPLDFLFKEEGNGFLLSVKDEEGNSFSLPISMEKKEAEKKEMAENNVRDHLGKLGGTIYSLGGITVEWDKPYFIPASQLNEMRRRAIEGISLEREKNYKNEEFRIGKSDIPFITDNLSCEWNVANKLSEQFYKRHGVNHIEPAFELKKGKKVMTTKHCLKRYLGLCSRKGEQVKEPLYLVNEQGKKFLLRFNCGSCEMEIIEN